MRCASRARWGWKLNEADRPNDPCAERPRRRLKDKPFRRVYIGLGSNINPERNLPQALKLLCENVVVQAISTAWETPPSGLKGPNFLNAAVEVKTQLSVNLLKSLVLRPIEIQMGRVRTANKYAPRTIDLDILVYEERTIDPKIWTLAFLAVPLAELIPEYPHAGTGETLREAADRLTKVSPVKPRPEILPGSAPF